MSRYGDHLRRIVGVDEIKKRLEDLENREQIDSIRGVGYQSGATGNTESISGSAGSSGVQAPNTAIGSGLAAIRSAATDAARAALTGMSNSNLPTAKNEADGRLDLTDILDNFADNNLTGSGDGFMSFGPNLNAIDGWTDCTTGLNGQVRFDSYIPPVTWADAFTPGTTSLAGFVAGTRYVVSGAPSSPIYGRTAIEAGQNAAADLNANPPVPADVPYVFTGITGSGAGTVANFTRAVNPPFTLPDQPFSCTIDVDVYCPSTADSTDTIFPPTGSFQLVPDSNGFYVGNQYDSEVPSIYDSPSSTVYMCFDSGRTAILTAGAGDTKLLYETDGTDAPLPGSVLHIYDGKGQLKGYADVAALAQYTP